MIDSLISAFSNRSLIKFFRNRNSSFVDYEEDLSDRIKLVPGTIKLIET